MTGFDCPLAAAPSANDTEVNNAYFESYDLKKRINDEVLHQLDVILPSLWKQLPIEQQLQARAKSTDQFIDQIFPNLSKSMLLPHIGTIKELNCFNPRRGRGRQNRRIWTGSVHIGHGCVSGNSLWRSESMSEDSRARAGQ